MKYRVVAMFALLGLACPLLAQDQWEADIYIKAVRAGEYKDDVKAVATVAGITEQELFDKYIARGYRVDGVLRVALFAKELDKGLADLLRISTKYAWGNGKRWKKFYKDANIPDDVVTRVTAKYEEMAKTALKNTRQHEAEEAARAAKVTAAPANPLVLLIIEKVTRRTAMPLGCTKTLAEDLVNKKQFDPSEAIDAAVFAAKTRHYERRLASQITPDMKGKVLASLCELYPPTAEQKEEINLVANYIKDEIKNKDAAPPVKMLLPETQGIRDTADIISAYTGVPGSKAIQLLREVEGEEEVAKMCIIAHLTGKDVADIAQARRTGGWYEVVTRYDLIEKMERIQDVSFAIMTAYEKKIAAKTPEK